MATGYAHRARRAGLRPAAHHRGARQRRRRARHRARQPRAARRHRRPAGPPPPRSGAVPRRAPATAWPASTPSRSSSPSARRTCPGRSSRAYHAAVQRTRPRARHRADGRLARARARGRTRCPAPTRLLRAGHRGARGGRRARRAARRTRSRPRSWSAPAPTTPEGWAALVRARRAPVVPGVAARPSAPARASRRTIRSSPGTSPAGRARLRAMLARHDAILAVGAPIFRQYAYEPGPLVNPGTRLALVTDDPREAHRSPSRARRSSAEPSAVCRGAGRARLPARDGAASRGRSPPPRRPPPPAPGEPLRAGHVLRRARRAPAGRRHPRRGVAVQPARAARARARPRAAGLPQRRDGRPRLRAARRRSACAWRCPTAPWSRWSATARRCTRSRRCGARRATASARCSSSWPTAATRSWTSSPPSTGQPAPWPAFDTVDIAAIARALGCEAVARRGPRRPARAARRDPPALAGRDRRSCSKRRRALTLEPAPVGPTRSRDA